MTGRATTALALGVLAVVTLSAQAQIPALFNYQVMLTNDTDEPLADQTVTMVFSLYDAESGGTQLWTETQTPTTNSIGVVSLVLGSVTPIAFDFDAPFWLEVEVNGQVLSPRRPLTASPYAGHAAVADDCDRLGGIDASEYALLSEVGGDGHSLDAVDGSPTDAVYVDGSGNVGVGTTSPETQLHVQESLQVGSMTTLGHLEVYGGGGTEGRIELDANPEDGGSVHIHGANNSTIAIMGPSHGTGGGGRLMLSSNDIGWTGVYLDGNSGGIGAGRLLLNGPSRSVELDMTEAETWAVQLPEDAIDRTEVFDEPGVASIQASAETSMTTGSVKTVAARTITVPNSGYVFAMGTAQLKIYNYDTGPDRFRFGVSQSQNAWSGAVQETYIELPSVLPGGWYYYQAVAQGLFQVSAGSHTFYLNVCEEDGEGWVSARQLTLMYFPTAYGTVDTDD